MTFLNFKLSEQAACREIFLKDFKDLEKLLCISNT